MYYYNTGATQPLYYDNIYNLNYYNLYYFIYYYNVWAIQPHITPFSLCLTLSASLSPHAQASQHLEEVSGTARGKDNAKGGRWEGLGGWVWCSHGCAGLPPDARLPASSQRAHLPCWLALALARLCGFLCSGQVAPGEQPKHVAVALERLKHVLDAELKAVAIRDCLQSVHALRVRGCRRVEVAVLLHHHRQSRDEGILRVEGAIPQCLLLCIPKIAHRMSGLHKHLPCTPACAGSASRPSTHSLCNSIPPPVRQAQKAHQRRGGGPWRKDDFPCRVPPRCHPPHTRHPLGGRHAPAEPARHHACSTKVVPPMSTQP